MGGWAGKPTKLADAARRLQCHVETLRIRIRDGRLKADPWPAWRLLREPGFPRRSSSAGREAPSSVAHETRDLGTRLSATWRGTVMRSPENSDFSARSEPI
jgi:hypothetical protein